MGFYQGQGKEVYNDSKKLVLKDIHTDEFIDDFSEKGKSGKLIGNPCRF